MNLLLPLQPSRIGAAMVAAALLAAALLNRAGNPTRSYVNIYDMKTGTNRTIYAQDGWLQAPLWTHDGKSLIYLHDGRLFSLPVDGRGAPVEIPTGAAAKDGGDGYGHRGVNNDHVLSPDGRSLAVSSGDIWIIPVGGVTADAPAVQVTDKTGDGPSYAHSWSPDGGSIAYCAERGGRFDVYAIPASARKQDTAEVRLTTFDGAMSDGPDYSPDGRHLYFNSNRTTGTYQVWRTGAGGGGYEALTTDARDNWFPHPSPDNRTIVYLSFPPGTLTHDGEMRVELRALDNRDLAAPPRTLASFFGGQGTINVNSWAPDSSAFAYVSYRHDAAAAAADAIVTTTAATVTTTAAAGFGDCKFKLYNESDCGGEALIHHYRFALDPPGGRMTHAEGLARCSAACCADPSCDWFDVADRMVDDLTGTCGPDATGDPARIGNPCPPGAMCCWIKVWDRSAPVNVTYLAISTAGQKLR